MKINNLNNLNVESLDFNALSNYNGGSWFSDVVECHGILIGFAVGSFINGFEKGFHDVMKNN
jgi:hypothetical protein